MIKEILEYLGLDAEKVKTLDEFKASFDKDFVRQSMITEDSEFVKPIVGKYFGKQETEATRLAKAYNIDISKDDYKSLKFINEKYDYIVKQIDGLSATKIADLEKKVNSGNDEKLKDAMENFNKIQSKLTDTEALLERTKTEFEGYKTTASGEIKKVKLNTLKSKAFDDLKLKSTITQIEKKGFMAELQDKYEFQLDENEKLFITDKEGKRIASTKTTGTFKDVNEVLIEEATIAKVYQENTQGGKPAPVKQAAAKTDLPAIRERTVAARME